MQDTNNNYMKYQRLARILEKKGFKTFDEVQDYMGQFEKYDNWTYRDIDKVVELLNL